MLRGRISRSVAVSLGLALGGLLPVAAGATEIRMTARTLGEGYSVRTPGPDGVLLTRRRLVQYVNLGVYEMLPPRRMDEFHRDADDGQLQLVTSLRLRHDFGTFLTGAGPNAGRRLENIDGRQIDLLYGYLEGRKLGGWVDMRVGRQFEMSGLDWYAFDGAWVRARTPAHLGIEAFGGFTVNGSNLFGYPTFELDGTDGPEHESATSVMAGAALSIIDLPFLDARVAYRQTFTPASLNGEVARDEAGAGGGLPTQTDQEVVSARAALRLAKGQVAPFGAARYNLGTGRLDDVSAGTEWHVADDRALADDGKVHGQQHTLRAMYLRTQPAFDLDSIFNVFASRAFEDMRLDYIVRLGARWTLGMRGRARLFRQAQTAHLETDPGRRINPGYGGGASAAWQHRRFSARVDGFGLGGEGGIRAGGSVDTRTMVLWDRVALDGRIYAVYYQDEQVEAREGYGVSLQAGTHIQIWKGIYFDIVGEESFTPQLSQAFRSWAMLGADWNFRAGRGGRR